MKIKFTSVLLFTLFSTLMHSQITKGTWLVGGSADFRYVSINNEDATPSEVKQSSFNISPNVGYFFYDKLAAGTSMYIAYSKSDSYPNSLQGGIGPFVRYYVLDIDKSMNIFGQAKLAFGTALNSAIDSDFKSTEYIFPAGTVFFFNDIVGLETSLNYSNRHVNSSTGRSNYDSFFLGIGFQIHLANRN